jgi:hypothetical protein
MYLAKRNTIDRKKMTDNGTLIMLDKINVYLHGFCDS